MEKFSRKKNYAQFIENIVMNIIFQNLLFLSILLFLFLLDGMNFQMSVDYIGYVYALTIAVGGMIGFLTKGKKKHFIHERNYFLPFPNSI